MRNTLKSPKIKYGANLNLVPLSSLSINFHLIDVICLCSGIFAPRPRGLPQSYTPMTISTVITYVIKAREK